MRISDWSSDVCSSDLYTGIKIPSGLKARTVARYKQIFRTKFCIRIGIFPFDAEDGTAEIDIIANYAAVEHAIFAGRVEADIVVSAEDANIRPIEGGCFILRSEEHTSELQSLMRISYAVF